MAIKAETSFSLKDQLFNETSVRELARAVKAAYPRFDDRAFQKDALTAFPQLELKQRISHLAKTLQAFLPKRFDRTVSVLRKALPPPLDPTLQDDDFGVFIWVVPGELIADIGCREDRVAVSLEFLREATMRFSSEGAIRPFLNAFPEQTMAAVRKWAKDDNYHVRRLASEGIRPLLPWAPRADVPFDEIVAVLDELHADPTRYVTRSVANTLNDIAKLEPKRVVDALSKWRDLGRQSPAELKWMTRHALRTLTGRGDPQALRLLGYTNRPQFTLQRHDATTKVIVGEEFRWSASLLAEAKQRWLITMNILFLKANGKHSAKVFRLKDLAVAKGEVVEFEKRQPFKPLTTRTLYPGVHHAELLVNGQVIAEHSFEVVVG